MLLSRLAGVAQRGHEWAALCPAHPDKNPSLSIRIVDGGKILLHCHAGCATGSVIQAVGLEMSLLMGTSIHNSPRREGGWAHHRDGAEFAAEKVGGTIEHIYEYPSVDGLLQYVVARIQTLGGKTFRPLHLAGGRWHLGDPERLLPLFQLPSLLRAYEVVVCEGEKCVLQFEKLGVLATTSAHGAKSAKKTDWNYLKGKKVILALDNDAAGRGYGEDVHRILTIIDPDVQVFLLELPGLDEGEDVVDWVTKRKAAGLSDDQVASELAELLKAARLQPNPNITHSTNITGGVGSSAIWPVPQPVPLAKVPLRFPIETAFPPSCAWLKDFIRSVADAYQVPDDVPALLALAAFGLSLSRTVEVAPQPDWREPVAVYVLLLLQSGERKSAVFAKLINPIRTWQQQRGIALAASIATVENDIKLTNEKLSRKRAQAAKTPNADVDDEMAKLLSQVADLESNKPKCPSLVATESTTEAIVDLLVDNNERGMIAAAEGDILDVMLGRYGQGKPNFGLWLSGHAGDSVDIRRKGRPTVHLHRPALTVALAIQPEAASDLLTSKAAAGRGVLARFFFSRPQSKLGHREMQPPRIPTGLLDHYGAKLHHLLDEPVPEEPSILQFDDDAARLFLAFREQIESELRAGGKFCDHAAWGSKLAGAIARIAGILHCIGVGRQGLISEATMRAALEWAPYLESHERHVVWLAGDDSASVIAERILGWIRRDGRREFRSNHCYNGVRGSLVQEAKDVEQPLTLLEELGWIRPSAASCEPRGRGRPPSRHYQVNPHVWSADPDPSPQNTQNTRYSGSDAADGDEIARRDGAA